MKPSAPERRYRKRLALAFLASLVFLAACSSAANGGDDRSEVTGGPEPTWSVACASGETPIEAIGELELACLGDEAPTSLGTSGSRPLLVVLWASWCGPCVEEAPEIEAFHQAFGDRVDVVGVDTADTREAGRWFAEDFDLTYPSLFDPDETVRIALGVPALPGIAFVAPDGTVAELVTEPGATTDSLTATAESAFGLELS